MAEFQYENTCMVYNISGKGIPILFIHPPAMGRIVFRYQEELNRYFTIITPDLSGNGDTRGPEKKVTIQSYVNELKALLNHLQIEKDVIRHHRGALRYVVVTLPNLLRPPLIKIDNRFR